MPVSLLTMKRKGMNNKTEELEKNISRSVIIYIIGSLCFVLFAFASIWFGYYLICFRNEHDLPLMLVIFSLAGVLLLWEMVKSFRFDTSLPESYRQITQQDYPALFGIMNEVTTTLKLSSVCKVYICPEAKAAVFIQPHLRNILFEPQRCVVIGLGFLTQMDDDEIRAMLYHEFGHYAQTEMKKTISVYTLAQFSRSFVSIKELSKPGTWELQVKTQLLLFTYFTIWTCKRINKAYSRLSRQMEYDADDVSAKYVGAQTLQLALLHAACLRYNYDVVQWGLRHLQTKNIQVDNPYEALTYVCGYSRPPANMLSKDILKRVERLGKLEITKRSVSDSVKLGSLSLVRNDGKTGVQCTAFQFAQWLKEGVSIYNQQRYLESSVELGIHLDKKKHRLPIFDGTYMVLLDGKSIGTGNFIKGYSLRRKTSPGKHRLLAYAPSGIISTPFEFEVVQDMTYEIDMDYKFYAKDGVYDVYGDRISMKA